MALSSSGLGRVVLSHQTGVRLPVALPDIKDARRLPVGVFLFGSTVKTQRVKYTLNNRLLARGAGSRTAGKDKADQIDDIRYVHGLIAVGIARRGWIR
jgi:hypothetical protein